MRYTQQLNLDILQLVPVVKECVFPLLLRGGGGGKVAMPMKYTLGVNITVKIPAYLCMHIIFKYIQNITPIFS